MYVFLSGLINGIFVHLSKIWLSLVSGILNKRRFDSIDTGSFMTRYSNVVGMRR